MQLKAAVVGTGFIGPVHIEGLRRLGVEVVGILGSSGEKSKLAAKQHCISLGYESFEQLLDDSSVDVVHITSPNQAHFEQASQALKRGKHVLCEKPLAMDSTQSAQLVQLARESGVAAGVNTTSATIRCVSRPRNSGKQESSEPLTTFRAATSKTGCSIAMTSIGAY